MDLPASVAALEGQLAEAGEIAPDPALFDSQEVFAAERERIFALPWAAVDHENRLRDDITYFRCDAANRSVLITRDGDGGLHALRNVCIHAGYPVCDAEEGPDERLICPYHGWEYTLEGRLVEPALTRIDPARLWMTRYPVRVRDGLIFVDLSGQGTTPEPDSVPAWLAEGRVTRRARYSPNWNWKHVLRFVKSSPQLFCADPADGHSWIEFAPLSLMVAEPQRAVLLQIVPKFAARTDLQLIELMAPDKAVSAANGDRLEHELRDSGNPPPGLDRGFYDWYWSLMSAA
jgi:nitrite reductase/ring-hydroxylating ferredoxin subunit